MSIHPKLWSNVCDLFFNFVACEECEIYYILLCSAAVPLSKDHKPNNKDEGKRIEDAGGFVLNDGKSFLILSSQLHILRPAYAYLDKKQNIQASPSQTLHI
jgi:hypothetical protein